MAAGGFVGSLSWVRRAVSIALAGVIVLALWSTRFGSRWPSVYYMTGPSMEPTLKAGEYFITWSPARDIEPGDLVIFRYEDEDGVFHVLRRVTALPGDTIAMNSGAIFLNGERQPWPFQILRPAASRSELALEGELYQWGPWVVPADSVVLLSDTRDIIGWPDSRFLGPIPLSDVLATAEFTVRGRRLR
jgi:signal peptidase I